MMISYRTRLGMQKNKRVRGEFEAKIRTQDLDKENQRERISVVDRKGPIG